MKRTTAIWAIALFVSGGMTGCKQSGANEDLITVDVTKSYPPKELILQDFMDVEYVPLETNDEFLCQGLLQAVGKNIIIVRNRKQDGNIFIYDRSGKALKKINKQGQGGEEYTRILRIALDEDNGELFVNDYASKKIVVYDLEGKFRRSFPHKKNAMYDFIYCFDAENLICNDASSRNEGQSFMIISKQDGSITKEIEIPFKDKKQIWLSKKDETTGMSYFLSPSGHSPIIPYLDHWLLVEPSADSVYSYSSDHTMTPIIARTPPIQSMNPEIFLFMGTLTNDYYFMMTVVKEGDVMEQTGFPSTFLVYDRQAKKTFRQTVYNNDYSIKKEVYMSTTPINREIPNWQILQAHELVQFYEKGELKGKLKEIAATLDEESNPVIMLVKHKNP